ncbi:MAG: replication initiation protein [Firmicutes bacterium]|nr:replication initiation protein [Bacillota bacterium]
MTKIKDKTSDKKFELDIARSHTVVKANDLIQKSRFSLSTQEQKIVLFLISKIKPDDKELREYDFEIMEFCKLCGIDHDSGGNYQSLKNAIKKLSDKSLWVKKDTGAEVLLRWVQGAEVHPKSGTITLRLSEEMKPHLLELKKQFTQYELIHTLAMRSQYAIRLYELLKSYEYRKKWVVDIDELKRLLTAENYTTFKDFRVRVIEIALREINTLTDINIEYEAIKKGRRFAEIEFKIQPQKKGFGAYIERKKRLD